MNQPPMFHEVLENAFDTGNFSNVLTIQNQDISSWFDLMLIRTDLKRIPSDFNYGCFWHSHGNLEFYFYLNHSQNGNGSLSWFTVHYLPNQHTLTYHLTERGGQFEAIAF